jgi:hypothetical protein
MASAFVLIDDGEVAGEVLHVVSVAFMRGGERRRWPGETVSWAGVGPCWWAAAGLLRAWLLGCSLGCGAGKVQVSLLPLFLLFIFCLFLVLNFWFY